MSGPVFKIVLSFLSENSNLAVILTQVLSFLCVAFGDICTQGCSYAALINLWRRYASPLWSHVVRFFLKSLGPAVVKVNKFNFR